MERIGETRLKLRAAIAGLHDEGLSIAQAHVAADHIRRGILDMLDLLEACMPLIPPFPT